MGLLLIPGSCYQVRCPSDRERALTELPLRMARDHSPPPPSPHTATGWWLFLKSKVLKGSWAWTLHPCQTHPKVALSTRMPTGWRPPAPKGGFGQGLRFCQQGFPSSKDRVYPAPHESYSSSGYEASRGGHGGNRSERVGRNRY